MDSESYFINSEKTLRIERDFKADNVIKKKNANKKLTFYKFQIRNEKIQNRFQR